MAAKRTGTARGLDTLWSRLTYSNHQAASKSGTAAGLPHQRRCGIVWLKARETLVLERLEFTLLIDVSMAQPGGARARQPSIASDWVSWDPVVRKPCLGISTVQWL